MNFKNLEHRQRQVIGLVLIAIVIAVVIGFGKIVIQEAQAQQYLPPAHADFLTIRNPVHAPLVKLDQPEPEPEPVQHNPACTRWYNLSDRQQRALTNAYHYGEPYDLGFTMSALALAESNAGQWRLNYRSNDFGLMQINIVTASNHLGVTNQFRRMELAERLVHDDELGFYLALQVLEHFRGNRVQSNQVWREMVMSYNEGYTWRRNEQSYQKATAYVNRVADFVTMLQECAPW